MSAIIAAAPHGALQVLNSVSSPKNGNLIPNSNMTSTKRVLESQNSEVNNGSNLQSSNAIRKPAQVITMGVGMSGESDQRDFIQRFIHRFYEEQSFTPPTRAEAQEMESVLYSVSFGKQEIFKKATYQAFSAAISS